MARYKDNAQLNSRTIRISLPAYIKLKGWCSQFNKTMADLIDLAVKLLDRELYIKPLFSLAVAPEMAMAASPVVTPGIAIKPLPGIAINGSRAASLAIKGKGVQYG